MPEWIVSKPDKTAYIDLRDDGLTFTDAERLLETIRPYYWSRSVGRIVIDLRGMDPIPRDKRVGRWGGRTGRDDWGTT